MRSFGHFLLSVAVALLLTGCAGKTERAETTSTAETVVEMPEITVFDINSEGKQFDDRIAKEIMKRTGVKIHVMDPTDDSAEKVELMLAYRDYPDMILIDINSIQKYVRAGYLVDLEPYMNQLPNVETMYGNILNRLRTESGNLYYLTNWYGVDDDSSSAFQIRYDYLCELAGKERADSKEPFTQDELLDLLRAFQKKYPEIGGKSSLPLSLCMDFGYITPFRGMYGMKYYYEENGNLYHLTRDPKYLKLLLFLNKLYREDLLDKEWVVNRRALFSEKFAEGRVFATACAYWDLDGSLSDLMKNNGEDICYYPYKVLGDGVDETETTYTARSTLGWDAIAVTDKCKNMDAVLKVIDFLASEDGQYLMLWGIEGEDWNYVNGKRVPEQEILDEVQADIKQAKNNTAIRRWAWFIKNGLGSDGSPYDMMTKYEISEAARLGKERFQTDRWDTSLYSQLEPDSGTEEALIWKNVTDIYEKAYPRLINASSAEKCIRLYHKMIEDMETEGLAKAEKVITENYKKRIRLWGKE